MAIIVIMENILKIDIKLVGFERNWHKYLSHKERNLAQFYSCQAVSSVSQMKEL